MIMHGLMDYGYREPAEFIAHRTRELLTKSGDREYYLTESGEGTGLDPFWGWTLLGYFMEAEVKGGFNPMNFDAVPAEFL